MLYKINIIKIITFFLFSFLVVEWNYMRWNYMRYVFIYKMIIEINYFKYPTLPSGARADVFTATGVGVTI